MNDPLRVVVHSAGVLAISIESFVDDTTIFIRGNSCLTKTELILKLYEKTSSSRINFWKSQALWARAYINIER